MVIYEASKEIGTMKQDSSRQLAGVPGAMKAAPGSESLPSLAEDADGKIRKRLR